MLIQRRRDIYSYTSAQRPLWTSWREQRNSWQNNKSRVITELVAADFQQLTQAVAHGQNILTQTRWRSDIEIDPRDQASFLSSICATMDELEHRKRYFNRWIDVSVTT